MLEVESINKGTIRTRIGVHDVDGLVSKLESMSSGQSLVALYEGGH
jgi:hypothetical protein